MFLDTVVYKGTRFNKKVILDVKTIRKPSSTHFAPGHPPICQKSLRKVFQISKERLMVDDGQRLPTHFERKIAIRNK